MIQPNYISLFASWIDKKGSLHCNKNYDFKLLYRASRDGFDNPSFHRNCDNKGATIWVAKIQGSTQLIGGYNPLDWSGNSVWKSTTDSFAFNFADGKNISTAKLGYVDANNTGNAIFCHKDVGPQMCNLHCADSKNWSSNNGTSYPDIGIPAEFVVENYEVFQVVKR